MITYLISDYSEAEEADKIFCEIKVNA